MHHTYSLCSLSKHLQIRGRGDALVGPLRLPNEAPAAPDAQLVPAIPVVGKPINGGDYLLPLTMTPQDIEVLMLYYNESFSILPNNNLDERRQKVINWVSDE